MFRKYTEQQRGYIIIVIFITVTIHRWRSGIMSGGRHHIAGSGSLHGDRVSCDAPRSPAIQLALFANDTAIYYLSRKTSIIHNKLHIAAREVVPEVAH